MLADFSKETLDPISWDQTKNTGLETATEESILVAMFAGNELIQTN